MVSQRKLGDCAPLACAARPTASNAQATSLTPFLGSGTVFWCLTPKTVPDPKRCHRFISDRLAPAPGIGSTLRSRPPHPPRIAPDTRLYESPHPVPESS